MERSNVGLVTTAWLRSRERGSRHMEVLEAFLLYHLSIGIDRALVFFDGDATELPTVESLGESLQLIVRQQRVEFFCRRTIGERSEVTSVDGALRFGYEDCVNYEKLSAAMPSDVASRQMLHAEMAMRRCQQLNEAGDSGPIRWLLHLDIDELFFSEGMADTRHDPASVFRAFVAAVENQKPAIDQVTVVNYEAVPTATRGGNYFLSATRFRRHTARIALSGESQRGIQDWQARSPHNQFFLFYDNGKSLVRVPDKGSGLGAVIPASVHHWRLAKTCSLIPWQSVSNFYDPRRFDLTVWHEPKPELRSCVLHYPVCGAEWLREKYERLGVFASVWGGNLGAHTMAIQPCFHLDARDAAAAGGSQIEELYLAQVMVHEEDERFWSRQLAAGVCEQISFPRQLLTSTGFQLNQSEEELSHLSTYRLQQPSDGKKDSKGYTVKKAWMLAAISDQYL